MTTENKCNIIVVDDHEMFRNGLKSLIEQEKIGQIVAEAKNGKQFLQVIETITPDVVLMDIDMPEMDGIEASEKALQTNGNLNILVLSMYDDYNHYSRLVSAGVKGFISKSSGKTELERGIIAVGKGEYYFSPDLLRNIIVEINRSKEQSDLNGDEFKFTDREEDILKLICKGYDSNEIADQLCLSIKTIDNYRSKLLQKTGVKNSVSLVIYAIKNKLIAF
jgi:DNA-binding NarL/FixJ family response regulator